MFTFIHSEEMDGDSTTVITHAVTWAVVADSFFDFLRGCGYELTRGDLSLHFEEME